MFNAESAYEFSRMRGAIDSMVVIARVYKVDEKMGTAAVIFDGSAKSDFLPVLAQRAGKGGLTLWLPSEGEQVVVLALQGEIASGIIIGSLPTSAMLKEKTGPITEYKDGTTIRYNEENHTIFLKNQNKNISLNLEIECSQLKISADEVEIKGALKAEKIASTGEVSAKTIKASGEISAAALKSEGDITVGTLSFKAHTHTSAAPGSPTTPPVGGA